MQGHVDAVGRVRSVTPEGDSRRVWFDAPQAVLGSCIEKGSIAVDGVSLTVAAFDDDGFEVALIPHTLAVTTLGALQPGDELNLEADVLGEGRRAARGGEAVMSSASPRSPPIEEAVEDIRNGKMVVVVDDPERENEGDLVVAAQFATAEAVNFMATHARGLICLCLTDERCEELGLPQMTQRNEARLGTAFTISVEAREGVTTGISAADRAHTIQVAIDPPRRRTTSSSPATSSRSARATAASSCAPARPRPPSTSRGSPGSPRPASSARS